MQQEYIVVQSYLVSTNPRPNSSETGIIDKVNELIANGYTPLGGIAVHNEVNSCGNVIGTMYSQALIKQQTL